VDDETTIHGTSQKLRGVGLSEQSQYKLNNDRQEIFVKSPEPKLRPPSETKKVTHLMNI